MKIKLGLFYNLLRLDEKLIINASKKLGVEIRLYQVTKLILDQNQFHIDFDIALNRCLSNTFGRYTTFFLESIGVKVVNSSQVVQNCEDKFVTSLLLKKNQVPTVDFMMVFSLEEAKKAVEVLGGYPVVIKSPLGSWGRLMAKVNDEETLEAIVEHKFSLAAPYHKALYLQKFIEKNGKDIRVFVIGDEVICAIYRQSGHWITNTARGGKASNCPLNQELINICQKAALAVGGGILAMDVFETKDGYLINEINHTMEFKNSEAPTGVSISSEIVRYCLNQASNTNSSSKP